MTVALAGTDIATASTILKGAVDVTLRKRLLTAWLDKEGRINKNLTGKDLNWTIEYKEATAQPFVQGQPLTFNNDNFNIQASQTPSWFYTTSGMSVIDVLQNSGPTQIVDNYARRVVKLGRAMSIKLAKDIYADATTNTNSIVGLATVCKKSGTITTANTDLIAPPVAGATTYAGLDISLGAYGGSWSSDLAYKPNVALATDWPDGHGSADNAYDATSPRLYNENTTRWIDPGAAGTNSNWRTNCIAILSRANTDLRMNSIESMMPNIHISGSSRHQQLKDQFRTAYRDIKTNAASADNLGYYDEMDYEGSAITLDHECPADRTYSLCAQTLKLHFYGTPPNAGARSVGIDANGQMVSGGMFTTIGPVMIPGSLDYTWIMLAGGMAQIQPKWLVCTKDWTV